MDWFYWWAVIGSKCCLVQRALGCPCVLFVSLYFFTGAPGVWTECSSGTCGGLILSNQVKLVPWGPLVWIDESRSGIGWLVTLSSPKILLLFSEMCKPFGYFILVGDVHLNKFAEVFWGIWQCRLRWVRLALGFFYYLILLLFSIRF